MAYKKLLTVLECLSSEQMQKLELFIHSPYFNQNKSMMEIFSYLRQQHPQFAEEKISDKAILKHVKGIRSTKVLANRMTRIFELTERFLSMEYSHDKVMERIGTLQAYKKLSLTDRVESLIGELKKKLEQETFRDFDYWWRVHRLEEEIIEGFDNKIKRVAGKTMQPVIDSLDHFHAVKKLRYMCDQVNIKHILGNDYSDKFHREMLDFISKADLNDPYLFAYSRIYLMFSEEDGEKAEQIYDKLETYINKSLKGVPKEEVRSIISYMQIFCARRINAGKSRFQKNFFELINFRMSHDILLENGRISPLTYDNIIACSLKLKEFNWTKKFIESYTDKIPDEFRTDFYNFNMALLNYHQQKYDESLLFLRNTGRGVNDVTLNFAIKRLVLKVQIEKGDRQAALQNIPAYVKLYQRKPFSQ